MKAKEFEIKKRDPNWKTMQDIRRSGAGGEHKDKKKAEKQGYEKHKGKSVSEGIGGMIAGGVGQFIGNKIDPLHGEIMRAHGEMAGRKAEYTIRKYMHLLQKALKQQLDSGEKEGVSEGDDGDLYSRIMNYIAQHKDWNDRYGENEVDSTVDDMISMGWVSSVEDLEDAVLLVGKMLKRDNPDRDVEEASDFGEPREILEDVLRTLEREVEWPLTDVMDPREVKQLLAPIVKAVNDKMLSMEEGRKDYGYDSFGNSLRPGDDEGSTEPPNNFAIYINGKKWKVFQGKGQYADDEYEMQQFRQLQAMAARKSQETGKKWEVSRTLEPATK